MTGHAQRAAITEIQRQIWTGHIRHDVIGIEMTADLVAVLAGEPITCEHGAAPVLVLHGTHQRMSLIAKTAATPVAIERATHIVARLASSSPTDTATAIRVRAASDQYSFDGWRSKVRFPGARCAAVFVGVIRHLNTAFQTAATSLAPNLISAISAELRGAAAADFGARPLTQQQSCATITHDVDQPQPLKQYVLRHILSDPRRPLGHLDW